MPSTPPMVTKPVSELITPQWIVGSKVPLDARVTGIVASSAEITPGCLFFAIRGRQQDGHHFAQDAVAKGALAAVVEDRKLYAECPRAVLVPSTRRALAEAASRWFDHPSRALRLAGVTGTNGKTTTTFLLKNLWVALGIEAGLIGSIEYQVGSHVTAAPLTTPDPKTLQALLAQMREQGVQRVAMEVSSIALDQSRVQGCEFAVAAFTNFTQDHLDYHGDMAAYLAAKEKLFSDHSPHVAVFNQDDPRWTHLARAFTGPRLTYSTQSAADIAVRSKVFLPSGTRAEITTPQGLLEFTTPLLGEHNLSNTLAVIAVECALGGDLERAVACLEQCSAPPGRLERVAHGADRPTVYVDYAHTQDALRAVLTTLQKVRGQGRIWTVFGCGGDRDPAKRPHMGSIAASLSDCVVVTSDNPRTEDPNQIIEAILTGIPKGFPTHVEPDREKAIVATLQGAQPDDFVLVAGKGHETVQIVGTQKRPFDDRAVIRKYYSNIH